MSDAGPAADRRSLLQSSLQALEAMEAKLAAAEAAAPRRSPWSG